MLAEIGIVSLIAGLIVCAYAVVFSILGQIKHKDRWIVSGRNAALASFPLVLLANVVLLIALMTEQYQISYVWSVTNPTTPMIYRITALWGSQKGSLLFWSLLMSVFIFGAIVLNWKSQRRLMPYAIAVMMATLGFFIGLSLFLENPFERYWIDPTLPADEQVILTAFIPPNVVPPDLAALAESALGLNPLLRHFGMIIHPPMLYLGFVGMVIPFAFAISALASGELSTNWIKISRRWALVAWLFLSLGLILGGRWAYDVLGWGGYWGWDPVENAAFLPWLVGTGFIHSVMIQEKRGMLKVWNMVLIIAVFSSVMFGTFATRSGVIESVHSFARSEIGFPMLVFWATMTIIGIGLLLWRRSRGELQDEHQFVGLLSRESLFVVNNIIFLALTLVIFFGSFGMPIISELVFDTEITLGTEYFMIVTPPLFAAMYLLMGVAPLTAWTATSGKRLGKALLIPLILTIVTVIVAILLGTHTFVAIFAYFVIFLAGYVALYEIYRGIVARHRTRGENWIRATTSLFSRNQRRYGGYVVHLGIVIIGIGVIGSTLFQFETQQTLQVGGQLNVQDYVLTFDNFTVAQGIDGRIMNIADMTLERNNQVIAKIRPRIDEFDSEGMSTMTIAGAHSTLENDFYVLLVRGDSGNFTFKIYINPLVNLVWWGGIVLIIGTLIAAWPKELSPKQQKSPKTKTMLSTSDKRVTAS